MVHHPEYAWLEEYAAGSLALPIALCVGTHLHFCADCRRQVELLQSVGGALLEELPPVPVADDLLQRVLARIDAESTDVPPAAPRAFLPGPLRRFAPNGYDALRWSKLLPRMRGSLLKTGDRSFRSTLHRVQPGGGVPRHDHRGLEFTVVLQGSFSDEFGVYIPGDFIERNPGVRHHPVAALNAECICLTVEQAPVRFTGFFWRWLNPFLR